MPTHKLNWITKIQVNSSKGCIKQNGTESVQKKAVARRIFILYLDMSNKSEKLHACRG